MGYTHDTDFAQFIYPQMIKKSAGTWSEGYTAGVWSSLRTAEAGGFVLTTPIMIPSNLGPSKGARLRSVEMIYQIGTAAGTGSFTPTLYQAVISSDGVVSGQQANVSMDEANGTDALRRAIGNHRLIASLWNPAWVKDNEYYSFQLSMVAAATTVVTLYGAIAHYDLRA